jgi:hypothetical protein
MVRPGKANCSGNLFSKSCIEVLPEKPVDFVFVLIENIIPLQLEVCGQLTRFKTPFMVDQRKSLDLLRTSEEFIEMIDLLLKTFNDDRVLDHFLITGIGNVFMFAIRAEVVKIRNYKGGGVFLVLAKYDNTVDKSRFLEFVFE